MAGKANFLLETGMPLDASDKIRKVQEIAIFQGYAIEKQTSQPGVNVSTCAGFYGNTTIRKFGDYTYRQQVEDGLQFFSTCKG